ESPVPTEGSRPTEGSAPAGRAEPHGAERPEELADSVARLGEMLDRAGFDCHTTRDPDGGYTQRLRRCPVLGLARQHPEVVRTSHLGMAQEILGHQGVAAERVSLEALAEPGARVRPRAGDRTRSWPWRARTRGSSAPATREWAARAPATRAPPRNG